MRLIDDFPRVYPRLWTVWVLALAVVLTLAEIFLTDALTGVLTRLQLQMLQLALLVAALVARGLGQSVLRAYKQEPNCGNDD